MSNLYKNYEVISLVAIQLCIFTACGSNNALNELSFRTEKGSIFTQGEVVPQNIGVHNETVNYKGDLIVSYIDIGQNQGIRDEFQRMLKGC